MLAGKSLLILANNIEVLACNRSGEPKQCATVVSSIYQTNERNFWFRSDRKALKVLIYSVKKNEVR